MKLKVIPTKIEGQFCYGKAWLEEHGICIREYDFKLDVQDFPEIKELNKKVKEIIAEDFNIKDQINASIE